MPLTASQQSAANALQAAEDAALAVADSGDGNYDRTLAAKAAGICAAIIIREPNWSGFRPVGQALIDWSNDHPPR